MANPKLSKKTKGGASSHRQPKAPRKFEAESLALQSLRLIAAPNPKDDLSEEEIAREIKRSEHSTELIAQLIDYIKSL